MCSSDLLALAGLGLRRGDTIAILSENRPEWLVTDMGAQCMGFMSTGIYPTSSPEQVLHILNDAEVRVLDDGGPLIVGHGAVFNSESVDLGGWREVIAPGAFKRTLRNNPDVDGWKAADAIGFGKLYLVSNVHDGQVTVTTRSFDEFNDVGVAIGNYVRALVQARSAAPEAAQSRWLGEFARYAVLVLAFTMAVHQLDVAPEFVLLAFGLLFGGLCLAMALAFGLGGRDVAGEIVRRGVDQAQHPGKAPPAADGFPRLPLR